MKIAQAGLMAALCYIGYAVFPAISASGTKIHIGNAFVVLSAYLLGGVYGGLSGAVGLSIADIVGGYAASAPRTFITKLVIGLIVGFVAHRIAKLSDEHDHAYVIRWSAIAAVSPLRIRASVRSFSPSRKSSKPSAFFLRHCSESSSKERTLNFCGTTSFVFSHSPTLSAYSSDTGSA